MKRSSWLLFCTAAVIAIGGGGYFFFRGEKEDIKWRFAKLERGDIRQRVSATGTLSALLEVDVGTQVSGMVTSLNADFNSIVVKDQVIATIDTTIHSQQVRTEEINVERTHTNLIDAERQYKRYQALAEQRLVSASDLESRDLTFRTAKATYDNALIALEKAKSNLSYCTIKAPVDGVVVSRKADVGQTVTASMSTPSLFIIAQDLRKMKLEITIDEADIAQVNVGQRANFTVDSIPDAQFTGTVSQVRLEPITNQNVVSYKVVVEVQNQTKQEIEAQKEQRQGMMPRTGAVAGQGLGIAAQGQKPDATKETKPVPTAVGSTPPSSQATTAMRRPEGASGTTPGGGPPDYDAMWERMKDRIQERQPGITKETWIQQARDREGQGGQGAERRGGPSARTPQQIAEAAAASGLLKAGGEFYQGEFVLRPGMTANVTIVTNQRNDVLRVPNTALRFDPAAYIKNDTQSQAQGAQRPQGAQAAANQQDRRARLMDRGFVARREDRVWVLDEMKKPRAITVRSGLSDGQFTEVTCEEVIEGMDVLIGVDEVRKNAQASGSPFQPGGFGGGRR